MTQARFALSDKQKKQFDAEGYLIVSGMLQQEETAEIRERFDQISKRKIPGHFEPKSESDSNDPLSRYPRVMHPHRFDPVSRKYMLHPHVLDVVAELYGEEPLAAQSMFYYKPPGARGQALHQDNFYLKVKPGTCIAAWAAIDAADEENGGLLVVPRTNDSEIVCPELADETESFTKHVVKVPTGKQAVPAIMNEGDVLFFNGNLIHGSYRNRSRHRFRRAFICHYAPQSLTSIGQFYSPLYRRDGTEIHARIETESGPCGTEFDALYPH